MVNANFLLELSKKYKPRFISTFRLCHGQVIGAKGSPVEGKQFIHCWIEEGNILIDNSNGKQIITRKERISNRIIESTVKRYTIDEMIKNLLKYEHYGEWE